MTIDIHLLPSWPQSQDSLKSQMDELIQVANRLGLYDAATLLSRRSAPAPSPEPPTDQQIKEWIDAKLGADQGDPEAFGWGWRCFKEEAFAVTIRAALERWGHR